MKKIIISIKEAANKHSSGRKILFFFIVTHIIYGIMLVFTIPKVMQYSGGMKILDMLPTGYSANYVQELFAALGEVGRSTYLFQQIPLDLFYPGLFGITYTLLLTLIFKTIFQKENKFRILSLTPVFAGAFDYLENAGIIIMLTIYPTFKPWLASLTNIFSVLKSFSITFVFIVLIIAIIVLISQKIRNRGKVLHH